MIRFKIKSKSLFSVLKESYGLIGNRASVPVLETFLFRSEAGKVTVTSGDTESVMMYLLDGVSAEGEGSFCLNAKKGMEIMKNVPDCELDVVSDANSLKVRYTNGEFNLTTMPGDEYPRPTANLEEVFSDSFDASDMIRGLEHSLFAASTDSIRPIMTAVCMDVSEDCIAFVASDTHILSLYRILVRKDRGWQGQLLIGSKAASMLCSLLKTEKSVTVTLYQNALEFVTPFMKLRTKIIRGTYPDYKRIFPREFGLIGSVNRDNFTCAIRRASLASAVNRPLVCGFSGNRIEVSAYNPESATSATENVPCVWECADLDVGVNPEYIRNILTAMNVTTLRIKANSGDKPMVFVPMENEENAEWSVLMMPMQIIR